MGHSKSLKAFFFSCSIISQEICLYLDEERNSQNGLCANCNAALEHVRDDGDGSSSSTNADEPQMVSSKSAAKNERLKPGLEEILRRQKSLFNGTYTKYLIIILFINHRRLRVNISSCFFRTNPNVHTQPRTTDRATKHQAVVSE
jgi:hypothetical protein